MKRQFDPNFPQPTSSQTTLSSQSQTPDNPSSTVAQSSASAASTSTSAGGMSTTTSAVIAVVVIGAVLIVVLVFLLRKTIQSWWKRRSSLTRTHTHIRARSSSSIGPITATQLASATSLPHSTTSNTANITTDNGGVSGGVTDTTRRTERVITRGGRRWGRTGSQRSTTTLPLYSEDPGEEDAVLIRKRESMRSQRVLEEGESGESDDDDDGEGDGDEREGDLRTREPVIHEEHPSALRSPSLDDSPETRAPGIARGESTTRRLSGAGAVASARGWAEIPSYDEATSPSLRSADLPSQEDESTPTPTDADGHIPQPRSQFFRGILNRLGRAEREAGVGDIQMSTDANTAYRNQSETERGGPIMSSRSAGHSLTSLLLHPTMTNSSTTTTITTSGRSSRSSSGTFRRPSFLQTGLPHEVVPVLPISAPVPGSAIRTGYLPPKKGFTPDQIKFLTSTDNIGKFGVPVDQPEGEGSNGQSRRRSVAPSLRVQTGAEDHPPPTWSDVVEDDRRRSFSSFATGNAVGNEPEPSSPVPTPTAERELTDVAITPVATPHTGGRTVDSNVDIEVVPPTPM